MEQEIHITLRFTLAIGKVNLNEIVYKLKELQNHVMLQILEQILRGYDDLISQCLSQTKLYPSKARKGLGRLLDQIPALTYDLKSAYALRFSRRLFLYERLPTTLISGLRRCHKLLQTLYRTRGME